MNILSWLRPQISDLRTGGYSFESLRGDLVGGFTAAVVALPLALAFGVASGAGPVAGLYGAIATGFFAALFGGTQVQVSGPTGPMTVVMGAVVATYAGSLSEAFTIVMLGGVLQMLFGILKFGRYIDYTPISVVSGFMSGIGVIIILVQLPPFVGLPTATDGVRGAIDLLSGIDFASIDPLVPLFSLATLAMLVLWPARIGRIVPAPLAVLVAGTGACALLMPDLSRIGDIPSSLPSLVTPVLKLDNIAQYLQPAFILALLGSIDSLLTSLVADSLTKTRHDPDKELFGQGLGNLVAGLLGAIPGAGATMRTVVNIRAGGTTGLAGMTHALVLLAMALGLGPVVAWVPNAVLASILLKVGWDIIDWGYWRRLPRVPREKAAVMLVTFALTVFVDLITAVAVGIILASFVNSRWLATEQLKGLRQSARPEDIDLLTAEEQSELAAVEGRVMVTLLHGSFSYASARDLARRDAQTAIGPEAVLYDFSHAGYIDPSAAMAIDEMVEVSLRHGRHVILSGLSGHALNALGAMGVLERVPAEQQFESRLDAVRAVSAYCRHLAPTVPNGQHDDSPPETR